MTNKLPTAHQVLTDLKLIDRIFCDNASLFDEEVTGFSWASTPAGESAHVHQGELGASVGTATILIVLDREGYRTGLAVAIDSSRADRWHADKANRNVSGPCPRDRLVLVEIAR